MTHHANFPGSCDGEEGDKCIVYVVVVLIASVSMRDGSPPAIPEAGVWRSSSRHFLFPLLASCS